jgi:hypothetical protein
MTMMSFLARFQIHDVKSVNNVMAASKEEGNYKKAVKYIMVSTFVALSKRTVDIVDLYL